MKMISLKNCKVTLSDATTPVKKSVELAIGDGDITFTETANYIYPMDRGVIMNCLEDDDAPMSVSFEFIFGDMVTSGGFTSPLDLIKGINCTSTEVDGEGNANPCAAYACDITIEPDGNVTECDINEKITLARFSYTGLNYQPNERKITCNGECSVSKAAFTAIVEGGD